MGSEKDLQKASFNNADMTVKLQFHEVVFLCDVHLPTKEKIYVKFCFCYH